MKDVSKMRKYNRTNSKKAGKKGCPVKAGHHRKSKGGYGGKPSMKY